MKKIIKLTLISLIIACIMGNVYAAISCNMELQTEKKEFNKNEEFTVDVKISNLQSDRGIISMGATLEYDKDSLELVKMEGQNGWETPINGSSYNKANGKMVLTRNGLGTNAETIFKITFKVKEESKQNLMIALKNITVADGYSPAKVTSAYKNITIKGGIKNPVPTPDDNDSSTTKNPDTNKDDTKKGLLPNAGSETFFWVVFIIGTILLIVATTFYIKMKKIKE